MSLKFYYGIKTKKIEITNIVMNHCRHNDILFIQSDDFNRGKLFGDPVVGVLKSIYIHDTKSNYDYTCDVNTEIYVDLNNNNIYTENLPEHIEKLFPNNIVKERLILKNIQEKLKINYGTFHEEYPEQIMAVKYISGNEKILEIGSNIGRNTLIMGYILKQQNSNKLVSLECDTDNFEKLKHNRDINNFTFHIENSALSKRNLIQKGWNTIVSDVLIDGYKKVNCINLENLHKKYNIDFDTLVLDCEGAFYYILQDIPEIINNINLIIIENDYESILHKNYVDKILYSKKFKVVYSRSGGFGECSDNFYEVWKKEN
jgi:FkbM family methyltransferase